MSFNLEQVRKAYQDPAISKIVELTKRIAKIESENIEIETDDLTGYGDVDSSKIIYNDYWNFIRRYAMFYDYIKFDGINDYIDLGAQTTLWSKNLDKFSFSFWFFNDARPHPYNNLFSVPDDVGDGLISCFIRDTGSVGIDVSSTAYSTKYRSVLSTNLLTILDHWYHIVGVWDLSQSVNANRLKMYIDGTLQSNGSDNGTQDEIIDVNPSVHAVLGRWKASDPDVITGRIRDFRWWNSAVTATDALNVYNNSPLAPTPNYWLPLIAIESGNPVDSIGGLTAFLQSGAKFPDRGETKICFEPDYDKFALDLRFETPHEKLYDYSGKQNLFKYGTKGAAYVFGEPCPTTGSEVWYRGGSKKNVGWKFSRDDKVYLQIYDQEDNLNAQEEGEEITREDLRMVGKTVGFSWIFRLNIASLTSDSSTNTLVDHYDDGSNSYRIIIGDDGNMKLVIERAGVEYKLRTNNAILNSNLGKDIELGYSYNIASSNLIKFYINGLPITSTTTTTEGTHSFNLNDTFLLSQSPITGDIPDRGFCDLNNIDLARLYNEKVLTDQQFLNHYRNKFTISDIDEGEVAITDASVIAQTVIGESFTDTSFTDTSFTAPVP